MRCHDIGHVQLVQRLFIAGDEAKSAGSLSFQGERGSRFYDLPVAGDDSISPI